MKAGLAHAGRFFREVWGPTSHARETKAQNHRRARVAKVNICASWSKKWVIGEGLHAGDDRADDSYSEYMLSSWHD